MYDEDDEEEEGLLKFVNDEDGGEEGFLGVSTTEGCCKNSPKFGKFDGDKDEEDGAFADVGKDSRKFNGIPAAAWSEKLRPPWGNERVWSCSFIAATWSDIVAKSEKLLEGSSAEELESELEYAVSFGLQNTPELAAKNGDDPDAAISLEQAGISFCMKGFKFLDFEWSISLRFWW